jgi:carbonic anhydrase/acetyltransferase-like protein (isoleucine patch superfamily)
MASYAARGDFASLFPGAIILSFRGAWPKIEPSAFIAPGAVVIGNVTIGEESSVWFQTTVRGDIAPITVGARCSVQDGTVIHVNEDAPVLIGDDVTIGHGALIHGTTIGNRVLVGMGAIVLSYSTIGANAVIAAGALIAERVDVPEGGVMVGLPAKQREQLESEQQDRVAAIPARYVGVRQEYLDALRPGDKRKT